MFLTSCHHVRTLQQNVIRALLFPATTWLEHGLVNFSQGNPTRDALRTRGIRLLSNISCFYYIMPLVATMISYNILPCF